MADDVDTTTDRDEREAPMRLAASRRYEGLPANGKCHWCHEPVATGLRFCDADCQGDHARRARFTGRW